MIEIREGAARAVIDADPHRFRFDPTSSVSISVPAWARSSAARAATVDVVMGPDPIQRGLLAGVRTPLDGDRLELVVPMSGSAPTTSAGARPGLLRRPVTPGLPDELVQPVLAGLLSSTTRSGRLVTTGAGYDVEGSSFVAMSTTARILSIVLHAREERLSEVEEAAIRALLARPTA